MKELFIALCLLIIPTRAASAVEYKVVVDDKYVPYIEKAIDDVPDYLRRHLINEVSKVVDEEYVEKNAKTLDEKIEDLEK